MAKSFSVWILKGRQSITASSNDLFYLAVCSKYLVSLQVTLSNDDSEIGLFASWFLEIKNRASMAVVCPDSMSFVTDKSRETTTKSQWLNLAKAYQVILQAIVFVILLLSQTHQSPVWMAIPKLVVLRYFHDMT